MQYATYNYYQDEYLGSAIPSEADFFRMERRARAFLDRVTFGRSRIIMDAAAEESREEHVISAEAPSGAENVDAGQASPGPKEEGLFRILARCDITLAEATETVRQAVCSAAEAAYEFSGRDGIASENNDGYSVSYESGGGTFPHMQAAVKFVLPAGFFYRGAEL